MFQIVTRHNSFRIQKMPLNTNKPNQTLMKNCRPEKRCTFSMYDRNFVKKKITDIQTKCAIWIASEASCVWKHRVNAVAFVY